MINIYIYIYYRLTRDVMQLKKLSNIKTKLVKITKILMFVGKRWVMLPLLDNVV